MNGPRPALTLVGVGVAAASAVLAGCWGTSDGGGSPDAGTPAARSARGAATATATEPGELSEAAQVPPRPRAGACYRLTLRQVTRPTTDAAPVPCRQRHTARTILVGRLDTVVEGHSLAVDSNRVQRQVAERCPTAAGRFTGGDPEARRLSRFSVVWFTPSLEEFDRGADWFRCDLIAFGRGDQLLPLPGDQRLRGVLDRPGGLETFGLCGTARPGAPGFERVACTLPHSWVAISTIPIQGASGEAPAYPGVDAVRAAGDDACAELVRERNDLLLEFSYGWEWPTREQWAAGQRHGYCWAPAELA